MRFLCFDAPSNEIAVPDELLKIRRVFGNGQILYEDSVLNKEVGNEEALFRRHGEIQGCAGHFVFLRQCQILWLLRRRTYPKRKVHWTHRARFSQTGHRPTIL